MTHPAQPAQSTAPPVDLTGDTLRAAGWRRAVKVYITKPGQPPMIVGPGCWVRIRGIRVDILCDHPYDFVQHPVVAVTTSLDRCAIGWEEVPL